MITSMEQLLYSNRLYKLYRKEFKKRAVKIVLFCLIFWIALIWGFIKNGSVETIIILIVVVITGLSVLFLKNSMKVPSVIEIGNIVNISVKHRTIDGKNGIIEKEWHEYTIESKAGKFVGTCLNLYLCGSELEYDYGEKVIFFSHDNSNRYIIKMP